MDGRRKKPTISDVAKAAGVSKTTVSRYINGKYELMGQDTCERLRMVIEMTGYRPSDVARSLKSHHSKMIGVIISDISTPFSSALISGINQVLVEADYIPIFVNCENNSKKELEYAKSLLAKDVDGLLVNSCSFDNPYLVKLDCNGFPVVLLDRPIKDHNFDIVASNIKRPIAELMYHLKQQGFCAPYMFTQELSASSTRALRHDAFLESATEIFELEDPVQNIRNINISKPEVTEKYIKDILETENGTPAFIGVNTMTTLNTVNVLKHMGARIPKDVGVCGPDDWSWGQKLEWAGLIEPGITTYVIKAEEIGAKAAELLLSRLNGTATEKRQVILDSEIVVRGSTQIK